MKKYNGLLQDLGIIVLSILVAVILAKTNALISILTATEGLELLGSFIAGFFFTSVFTTAPAIATLGELTQVTSIWSVALLGALGAVAGDLLIYRFVKDRVAKHLLEIMRAKGGVDRTCVLFCRRSFRWMAFLVGGLIIASPIPDEIGISLIGFSKMSVSRFILLSFIFNFIGIILIGLVAQTLA